ncbi:hypothetical protein HG537_0A03410 [Torulaspora globosa]|uniref:Pkr1-domain-containing protein n=1 Tax=Torulaspora globosa TaxID=48254 RepID=A0A7H9HJM2_9SACH|nr:hypothetical protein HG537_0A03410 [Torulaspora sp. CBS 2947]
MTSFFVALWESIFQPGTTPQLVVATHVSFIALLTTLVWQIYATNGNFHFYALFFIALCLWVSVMWFIRELKSVDLKNNEQLEGSSKEQLDETNAQKEQPRSQTIRSRKL